MRRRILIVRVGDHPFLRWIRDLYEGLCSRYTLGHEPRGITSIFPTSMPSPFVFRNIKEKFGYNDYFTSHIKDSQSKKAFEQPLAEDAELKIYLAGHGAPGWFNVSSLETSDDRQFEISVDTLAYYLDTVITKLKPQTCSTKPVQISLIVCSAGRGDYGCQPVGVQLLEYLHQLGQDNVLIKAREKTVNAPFLGHKSTPGKLFHFYLSKGNIFKVKQNNDLRLKSIKLIKKCADKTYVEAKRDCLLAALDDIEKIGTVDDQQKLTALKNVISDLANNDDIKMYRDGTGRFMRLFGFKSNTESSLIKLQQKISDTDFSPYEKVH